ncbi:MAG: cohesin domain-containing protein, partial [Thermoplasmatota archaeon]
MKKTHHFISSLLVVSLLILAGFAGVSVSEPSSTTTISVLPQAQTVAIDETFTVNITIDSSEPLEIGQAALTFNPDILEVIEVTDGEMFDIWLPDLSSKVLNISNQNGTIKGMTAMSPENLVSTGTLAVITFKATAAGSSLLQFIIDDDETLVATETENYVPTTQNGTVTVSEEPND